jgi:epoxide hydrolase-like predicted phosphatase
MEKIQTIIFDYGGVLAKNGFLQDCLWNNERDKDVWFKEMQGHLKKGFLGEISFKKFSETSSKISKEITEDHHKKLTKLIFEPNKEIVSLLKRLSKKYKIIILTNNFKGIINKFIKLNDLSKYLNKTYNSSRLGMLKEDKKIYQYLLKKESLKPEECILIDDNPKFIKIAKSLGIKTILFKNHKDSAKDLEYKIQMKTRKK